MNIASFIFRPDLGFLDLTSFQSFNRPSLSFGSSSRISLRRQSLSLSRALAPSGKHPNLIALSSYEKHPSTFRSHQFRGFRHSYTPVTVTAPILVPCCPWLALQRSAIFVDGCVSLQNQKCYDQAANRS
jgi:hypothetical protein